MSKSLSEYRLEDLQNEIRLRNKEARLTAINNTIDRLREDITYIDDVITEGSPGNGSYSVKFEVFK